MQWFPVDNIFPCQKCKHQFGSFEELEEHLRTHQFKSKFTNIYLTCGNYIFYSLMS